MSRRAALWGLLLAKVIGGWGLTWDIQWHVTIGRDSFWIAPHIMIYASVVASLLLSGGVVLADTLAARAGRPAPGSLRVLGLVSTRGFHLATWGMVLVSVAAPIDDLWHRLFGIDVTLWSPPHLLALFASAVNTLGCLLAATEVYPARSRARLAAVVVAGGLLYAGLRVTLDPAFLVAYTNGGVRFHAYAILAALVLPLALLPTARLAALRWAPLLAVVVALAATLAGEAIARTGFAILQPVSVIGEEIAKDPTSHVALGAEIGRKNRAAPTALWVRLLLPIIPALLMSLVDARRRPLAAALAYGVGVFAMYGWYLSGRPAFAPVAPTMIETAVALAVTILAALAGAVVARRLADGLQGRPPRSAADAVPHPAA